MKPQLSTNIKNLRKERKMTQEQLAEAMGVTVGAVYKWESAQSTPDLQYIMDLAELFGVSTDMLIGFEWRTGNAQQFAGEISRLSAEKRYEEACAEAERALRKFPNHFEVVYQSGLMYFSRGETLKERAALERAASLLEHAIELISQNTDDRVNEVVIRTKLAWAHLLMGEVQTALKLLKKHNASGVHNALIGMVLADFLHDMEGKKYLAKAADAALADLDSVMIGFANVFFNQKNYDAALDCLRWLQNMLRGIQSEEQVSYFDKYECILLETMAEVYCFKGEPETARKHLRAALEKARRYDASTPVGVGFYERLGLAFQPTYEVYDSTALGCLKRRLHVDERREPGDEDMPYLLDLWQQEYREVFPDEAI